MNIKSATKHFEYYLEGQKKLLLAIRKLAFIDASITQAAFDISVADVISLTKNTSDKVAQAANKNSHLFSFTPPEETLLNINEMTPISEIKFDSEKVKDCISKYCSAQRQCLLTIKTLLDINERLTKGLFRLEDFAISFLKDKSSFELAELSDRYTWFINLNYTEHDDILVKTIERVTFDASFVESSVTY